MQERICPEEIILIYLRGCNRPSGASPGFIEEEIITEETNTFIDLVFATGLFPNYVFQKNTFVYQFSSQ